MRKIKIFITVFLLYEFVVLTILQIPEYCVGVFNFNFCEYSSLKYFLMCIVLPILFALFIWWMPEISRLFCKNKCETPGSQSIKDIIHEIISIKDIERLITAAIVMGIQKFVSNHPKTTETLENIIDIIKNPEQKNK